MMANEQDILSFSKKVNVSRETLDRLRTYEQLLKKWNPAINLVSRGTLEDIWTRHFLDSAQLWGLKPNNADYWLDLGTGAGFPGLVIAILAAEHQPSLKIGLVESDARKAAFLLNTSQNLSISPKIFTERAEMLQPQGADVISARALAPLSQLLEFTERHKADNTICLFSKGRTYETELTNAKKYWTFDVQKTPSLTDSEGVILKIGGFGRV